MTRITIAHEFEFDIEADVTPGHPVKMPSLSDDIGHPAEPPEVRDMALILSAAQLKRLRNAVGIPWVRTNLTDAQFSHAIMQVLIALDETTFEDHEPNPDRERDDRGRPE